MLSKNRRKNNTTIQLSLANPDNRVFPYLASLPVEYDLNNKDTDGDTSLHTASEVGNASAIEMFVRKGADPTIRNDKNHTPLVMAVVKEKLAAVKQYISLGIYSGLEDFIENLRDEHLAIALYLLNLDLECTKKPKLILLANKISRFSCLPTSDECFEVLVQQISAGEIMAYNDAKGHTILSPLMQHGDAPTIEKALKKFKIDLHTNTDFAYRLFEDVLVKGSSGTACQLLTWLSSYLTPSLIAERFPNLTIRFAEFIYQSTNFQLWRKLFDQFASFFDTNQNAGEGKDAYKLAIERNNHELFKWYIENSKDSKEEWPTIFPELFVFLVALPTYNLKKFVETLLATDKININSQNQENNTLLHCLIIHLNRSYQAGLLEVIMWLRSRGAKLDILNKENKLAIDYLPQSYQADNELMAMLSPTPLVLGVTTSNTLNLSSTNPTIASAALDTAASIPSSSSNPYVVSTIEWLRANQFLSARAIDANGDVKIIIPEKTEQDRFLITASLQSDVYRFSDNKMNLMPGVITKHLKGNVSVKKEAKTLVNNRVTTADKSTSSSGFFVSPSEDFHNILVQRLRSHLQSKGTAYTVLLELAIKKEYNKLLRNACNACINKDGVIFQCIIILLEYAEVLPIDINEKGPTTGLAPIHYAAKNCNMALYELLIVKGANPLLTNNEGKNATEMLSGKNIINMHLKGSGL